jgi:hypothetical protein
VAREGIDSWGWSSLVSIRFGQTLVLFLLGLLVALVSSTLGFTVQFVPQFWFFIYIGGACLGGLMFHFSLKIAVRQKYDRVRHWMMAPILTSLFLVPGVTLIIQVTYPTITGEAAVHPTVLVFGFVFLSVLPFVIGTFFFEIWLRDQLSKRIILVSENGRQRLKLISLGILLVMIAVPILILLRSIFGFTIGLTLLAVGAILGILFFDISLRIGFRKRSASLRSWFVSPVVGVLFLLVSPTVASWAPYVFSTRSAHWFSLLLVFVFMSLVPLIIGSVSFYMWRRKETKRTYWN